MKDWELKIFNFLSKIRFTIFGFEKLVKEAIENNVDN